MQLHVNILDMNSIERTRTVKATRERVWRALTTAEEFSEWFRVKVDGPFEAGKRFDLVATLPGWEGFRFWFEIVEMTPPERFSYRWLPGAVVDDSDSTPTLVTFTLEEVAGGTKLTVLETGFEGVSLEKRARAFQLNTDGWRDQMASLERYLGRDA